MVDQRRQIDGFVKSFHPSQMKDVFWLMDYRIRIIEYESLPHFLKTPSGEILNWGKSQSSTVGYPVKFRVELETST